MQADESAIDHGFAICDAAVQRDSCPRGSKQKAEISEKRCAMSQEESVQLIWVVVPCS